MASPFEEYVSDTLSTAVSRWTPDPDIYAVGLYTYCEEDDLRRPAVRLIRNTLPHARLHSPSGGHKELPSICRSRGKVGCCVQSGEASSFLEASWSFFFWDCMTYAAVGTEFPAFPGDCVDCHGIQLRQMWIYELGLWYDDEFEERCFEESLDRGGDICMEFYKLCLRVGQKLFDCLASKFGRDIPVVFFNREALTHETMALTFLANPLNAIQQYIEYVCDSIRDDWRWRFDLLDRNIERTADNLEFVMQMLRG